jgi:hypothetical protein
MARACACGLRSLLASASAAALLNYAHGGKSMSLRTRNTRKPLTQHRATRFGTSGNNNTKSQHKQHARRLGSRRATGSRACPRPTRRGATCSPALASAARGPPQPTRGANAADNTAAGGEQARGKGACAPVQTKKRHTTRAQQLSRTVGGHQARGGDERQWDTGGTPTAHVEEKPTRGC